MSNRGFANAALYAASILIDAWETAQSEASHGDAPLARAFRPAILLHLRRAYGWCMLAVAGLDDEPDPTMLPTSVAAVAAPPAGRGVVPELREFELLERGGWVGDMLAADAAPLTQRANTNVLGSDSSGAGPGQLRGWCDRLAATMQRMDDLLDEC